MQCRKEKAWKHGKTSSVFAWKTAHMKIPMQKKHGKRGGSILLIWFWLGKLPYEIWDTENGKHGNGRALHPPDLFLLGKLPYEKCETVKGNMEMEELSILLICLLGRLPYKKCHTRKNNGNGRVLHPPDLIAAKTSICKM
jgi:hypothetical protein